MSKLESSGNYLESSWPGIRGAIPGWSHWTCMTSGIGPKYMQPEACSPANQQARKWIPHPLICRETPSLRMWPHLFSPGYYMKIDQYNPWRSNSFLEIFLLEFYIEIVCPPFLCFFYHKNMQLLQYNRKFVLALEFEGEQLLLCKKLSYLKFFLEGVGYK